MYDLRERVAVVTGAGRPKGLGEAMAKRLAADGAKVVVTDIGKPAGEQFRQQHIGTESEMDEIVGRSVALGTWGRTTTRLYGWC